MATIGGYPQNYLPATGFQWKNRPDEHTWQFCNFCNAKEALTNAFKVGGKDIPRHLINNIMKILGYFPIITGQIAGVFHIYQGCQALKFNCTKISGIGLIGRGVLEFFGLGGVYLVVDVAKLAADGINYAHRWRTDSFPPN